MLELVKPAAEYLPSYRAALESGWSPDNVGGAKTTLAQLAKIDQDPGAFLAGLDDPDGKGPPVELPDGRKVPRLPGYHRWIWDGSFCGSIGFRWQPGSNALPPHCLGHAGYAVVPWKRGRGCARFALRAILPDARARGLDHLEVTTSIDNPASQRVILACGGRLIEHFREPEAFGGGQALRYRIALV